jgi:hypothetical protein
MNKKLKHGSATTYQHHGCRCEACKKAASEKMRKYRETKTGQDKTREYRNRRDRLELLALQYVRENHPVVYKRLQREAY